MLARYRNAGLFLLEHLDDGFLNVIGRREWIQVRHVAALTKKNSQKKNAQNKNL